MKIHQASLSANPFAHLSGPDAGRRGTTRRTDISNFLKSRRADRFGIRGRHALSALNAENYRTPIRSVAGRTLFGEVRPGFRHFETRAAELALIGLHGPAETLSRE